MVTTTLHEDKLAFAERFGEFLVKQNRLPKRTLSQTLRLPEAQEENFSVLLVRLGLVAERHVAEALAELLVAPLIEKKDFPSMPLLEDRLSVRFLKEAKTVPIAESANSVTIALAAPQDQFTIDALRMALGKSIIPRTGVQSEIEEAIERLYGAGQSDIEQIVNIIDRATTDDEDVQHLKEMASEAPVVRLVNLIINRAIEQRASDIHIEPFEHRLQIRYRIDGELREVEAPPVQSTAAVISRIKLIAKLNIAERRLPQDGRIPMRVQGKDIDIRMSTVPTLHGESVVLRLLDKETVKLDFSALGFNPATLTQFREVLSLPHGILLVTGPTGSGKTTTLYTALQELNTPNRKVLTVEDPVEYQLEGINQIQTKPQIGLSFANALRSIMRQDPDIIMIGEMRDLETARIAVQSALTGHLVLSTLHTNDAGSSVTRMLDMGVEDYLVTSTVTGILAQRLVRRLCAECRQPYQALPELVARFREGGFEPPPGPLMLHQEKGCAACGGTGFKGRIALLEFLVMSDTIRSLILRHAAGGEIQKAAKDKGMKTMLSDGYQKALAGTTTFSEVLRVAQEIR